MKLRTGQLCLLMLGLALPAFPQTSPSSDQSETIRLLMERIDKLEKRVAELESNPKDVAKAPSNVSSTVADTSTDAAAGKVPDQPPIASVATVASNVPVTVSKTSVEGDLHGDHNLPKSSVVPTSTAANAGAPPAAPAQDTQEAAIDDGMNMSHPNLHISGFGAVDLVATNFPGSKTSFALPQMILHFASSLSPKVDFFSEWSFSPSGDQRVVEIERAIIRYSLNDYFKISFGRYHTPINYWNTAFHHGTWLQTSVTRPEMIVFGGAFMPPHFMGILAEGAAPADGLNFNYQIGMGNGRGFPINRAGTSGDINNNKAYLGNFFVKPDRLRHLQAGGSFYRDLISQPDGRNYKELITSGHVVWTKETPEVIVEFANVHHQQVTPGFVDSGHISDSQAFYVQVADRLPWFHEVLKPYYRYEYIHTPLGDGAFATAGVPTLSGSFVGIRYDVTNFAAFKVEYDQKARRNKPVPDKILIVETDFTF